MTVDPQDVADVTVRAKNLLEERRRLEDERLDRYAEALLARGRVVAAPSPYFCALIVREDVAKLLASRQEQLQS